MAYQSCEFAVCPELYPSPRQFVSFAGCLVRSRHRLKPPLIALHQRQLQLDVVLGRQYNLLRRPTYTRESLRDSKEETDPNFLPNLALTQPYLLLRVSALILVPPKIQYLNPLLNFLRLRPTFLFPHFLLKLIGDLVKYTEN